MPQPLEISAFPDHYLGDPWVGMAIGPITVQMTPNGSFAAPDGNLTRVRIQFRNGTRVFTIDSDANVGRDAAATITNAATWTATVAPIQEFLSAPGVWYWDLEVWKASVKWYTLYKGQITVVEDVTRITRRSRP